MTRQMRRELREHERADRATVRGLATAAGRIYQLTADEVLSRSRVVEVAEARFAVIHALRLGGWQVQRIGAAVGRDHSSVSSAGRKAALRYGNDPEFRLATDAAKRVLEADVILDVDVPIAARGPEARPPRAPRYNLPPPLKVHRAIGAA
jgi:chromosomal replication initiation ATPase DnaA